MKIATAYLLHGEWEPVVELDGRAIEWSGRFFVRKRDAMKFVATWWPELCRATRTKMDAESPIDFDRFPKQGDMKGRVVLVCFDCDTSRTMCGTVLREDIEEPGRMIIQLDDGRAVLSTECQYSLRIS